MLEFLPTSAGPFVAVILAALGAIVFGLAAVRQHGAVHTVTGRDRLGSGVWRDIRRLVRDRSWLLGAGQAALGGGLHVLALALAPITLVQPIGVLAVPTTVIATAARGRRRPPVGQVAGTVLSVAGIIVVTCCLLVPGSTTGVVPGSSLLAGSLALIIGLAILVITTARWAGRSLRVVALAVTAAMLFGLNSVLIRTLGEVVTRGLVGAEVPVLLLAVVGLAVCLPLGVFAMQAAYRSGSPQVVICCLTLMDPITAVTGGRLLLQDGASLSGPTLLGVVLGGLLTVAGVVLMSREYATGVPGTADPAGAIGDREDASSVDDHDLAVSARRR